jgi:hypothetical protein
MVSDDESRVLNIDGVKISIRKNSFLIETREDNQVLSSHVLQHLRQWCKWRTRKSIKVETWKMPK